MNRYEYDNPPPTPLWMRTYWLFYNLFHPRQWLELRRQLKVLRTAEGLADFCTDSTNLVDDQTLAEARALHAKYLKELGDK